MQRVDEIFLALACDAAAPFVSANVSVWHVARLCPAAVLHLYPWRQAHEFVMLGREGLFSAKFTAKNRRERSEKDSFRSAR